MGWYGSGNSYSGYLEYSPVNLDPVVIGRQIQWSLFMPKWQTDDYYENNFRINKYDAVTPYYKDNANLASSTAFTSGGEHYVAAGAVTVGLSAAVAFAAAALTF